MFHMKRVTVHITGMSCGHCLSAVNDALASQPGIQLESLRIGRAVVRYDDQVTSPATIESLINEAGYSATAAAPSDSDEAEERM
jgi:copper chaperone CopZ